MKRAAWTVVAKNRDEVLERIEAGESLTSIAAGLGIKRRFLADYFELPTNVVDYARSRTRAATTIAEQVIEIADAAEESVHGLLKAKLRMQSRQWLARHWDTSRYGEHPAVTQTMPIATIHAEVIRRRSAELQPQPAGLLGPAAAPTWQPEPQPADRTETQGAWQAAETGPAERLPGQRIATASGATTETALAE